MTVKNSYKSKKRNRRTKSLYDIQQISTSNFKSELPPQIPPIINNPSTFEMKSFSQKKINQQLNLTLSSIKAVSYTPSEKLFKKGRYKQYNLAGSESSNDENILEHKNSLINPLLSKRYKPSNTKVKHLKFRSQTRSDMHR